MLRPWRLLLLQAPIIVASAALLWLGLYPQPVLDLARPVLDSLQVLAPGSAL